MVGLGPRIWEQDVDPLYAGSGQPEADKGVRIASEQSHVGDAVTQAFVRGLGHAQRFVFDSDEGFSWMLLGHGGDEFAMTEADFQPQGAGRTEESRRIERTIVIWPDQS